MLEKILVIQPYRQTSKPNSSPHQLFRGNLQVIVKSQEIETFTFINHSMGLFVKLLYL